MYQITDVSKKPTHQCSCITVYPCGFLITAKTKSILGSFDCVVHNITHEGGDRQLDKQVLV